MNDLLHSAIGIAVAAVAAFVSSLGAWAIYQRIGASGVHQQLQSERGALIDALQDRVDHLEKENARLQRENELLRHDVESLQREVSSLQRRLIRLDHNLSDDDA